MCARAVNVNATAYYKNMEKVKKAGIIAGATIGGVIGGTLSVVGKMSNNKFIDSLGNSIIDSTIYTGGIVGELGSGAAQVVSGKVKKKPYKVRAGVDDLKSGGGKVVGNVVNNVKLVAENGGEIVEGVKEMDKDKIVRGTKRLAKVAAVGLMTAGAIIIDDSDEKDEHKEGSEE